jgi:organic radical activating enzyme
MQIPINIEHSFCSAKWLMVTMHFGMGENHSCYHPPIHRWDLEDVKKNPSALHNTAHKIKQREMMMTGIRPKECYYCFNMEDIDPNVISDRKRFTNETYALERRAEIINAPADKHIGPSYMEISFANVCNFACSYCSPGQSSTWETEVRKHGSYPIEDPTVHRDKMHDMIPEDNNPYIDAFWKWLPDIYTGLRYLRITGGEPLATRNFMKLLDYVAENENKDLTLVVNTNLCVPEKNLDLFFTKATALLEAKTIKGLEVYTSMDTWGEQAEYIRDGLDVAKWEATVRKVSTTFHVPIRVMVTFGLLSVFNFNTFVQKVIDMRADGIDIMFNCARLVDPKQFDLRILPDDCDQYFERVNDFITTNGKMTNVELETWQMVYQFWKARKESMPDSDRAWRRDQFVKFVNEYDKRRSLNFAETFPELSLESLC